jgi:hypothetical protein
MFREGVELAEALLFIERAIQEEAQRGPPAARHPLSGLKGSAFIKGWFDTR